MRRFRVSGTTCLIAGCILLALSLQGCGIHSHVPTMVNAKKIQMPDSYDTYGQTMMHAAASTGELDVIEALLERGADIDIRNVHCVTPLTTALLNNQRGVASYLLERGANPDPGNVWLSPLLAAIQMGNSPAIVNLLHAGAQLERRMPGGETALFLASYWGLQETVQKLLAEGADANAMTVDGRTPLHAAAYNGHLEVANLLIDYGAEVLNAEKSEQGLYATARLHELLAFRARLKNDNDQSVRHFEQAVHYYELSSKTFGRISKDAKSSALKKNILLALAVGVAHAGNLSMIGSSNPMTRISGHIQQNQLNVNMAMLGRRPIAGQEMSVGSYYEKVAKFCNERRQECQLQIATEDEYSKEKEEVQ